MSESAAGGWSDEADYTVYVLRDGKLHIADVEVLILEQDYAVIERGIEDGDMVILTDLFPASEGMLLDGELDASAERRGCRTGGGGSPVIAYFVRHPTAANLLMLVVILLGVLGAMSIRRDVFPEFSSDFVNVQVIYKGASAEEVEEMICQRIEEEIEGIEGIEQVESTAREGVGIRDRRGGRRLRGGVRAAGRRERRRHDRQLPARTPRSRSSGR